jgi:hypothetical protein
MRATKSFSGVLWAAPLLCVLSAFVGCATSTPSTNTTPVVPSGTAPTIVSQPASITVPAGVTGTFAVGATGSSLAFQWYKNGTKIAGATAASYTTPVITTADSGASYMVTVSNSLATINSQPATLTTGGRAPNAGDLRFQQVDSANTVYGYQGQQASNLLAPGAFAGSIGTPLEIVPGQCSSTPSNGTGCAWQFATFLQPSGAAPLTTGYAYDLYTSLQSDIASGYKTMPSLQSPNVVVTSMSFSPTNNLYALSYVQTTQPGSFDLAQHSVSFSQIQAAATQEALSGRVITAVTLESGNVDYFSYGWTGDTGTIYESRVLFATFNTVGSVATTLASQGYIITAVGDDPTNPASQIILIGTRVQGDTAARPILIVPFANDPSPFLTGGYAVVGVAPSTTTGSTVNGVWITER